MWKTERGLAKAELASNFMGAGDVAAPIIFQSYYGFSHVPRPPVPRPSGCPAHLVNTDGDGELLLQCMLEGLFSDHHDSFRCVHEHHNTIAEPIGGRHLIHEVHMTCMRQEVIRDTNALLVSE